jgi:hypothetical protein
MLQQVRGPALLNERNFSSGLEEKLQQIRFKLLHDGNFS